MSILVTGGAGFVGSHLVDRLLLDPKAEVVILDNLSTGRLANVEKAVGSGRAVFAYCDVAASADELRAIIAQAAKTPVTEIYHLASPASPEAYGAMPWETLAVNGLGTMSLIEIALETRARMLFSSTSEVYGDPSVHPQPETYFGNVNPIGPRACYDEGKRFGEAAMSVAVRTRGLDGRIVRLFNGYGPRMAIGDGRLIPSALDAIADQRPIPLHGTAQQSRSMTYVDDLVNGLILVMNTKFKELQPVNLGSEDELSVEAITRALADAAGVAYDIERLPARPEDPQRRRPDSTIAQQIGWTAEVDLQEGLKRTLAWFNAVRGQYASA